MSRKIIVILSIFLFFCLTSCQANPANTTTQTENTKEAESHLSFKAQYIRTDGGSHVRTNYPFTAVIQSAAELKAYYDANKAIYNLNGFWDTAKTYDDTFFKDHLLVLVLLEEPSGSNRHEVTSVEQNDTRTEINITRKIPRVGTADMAEWHIIIELKKADYNGSPITVKLNKQVEEMTTS